MTDRKDKTFEVSEDNELAIGFKTGLEIPRSPVIQSYKIITRSISKRTNIEEQLINKNAEVKMMRDQIEKMNKRMAELTLKRENKAENKNPNRDNETANENLNDLLREICRRMEKLEDNAKKFPNNYGQPEFEDQYDKMSVKSRDEERVKHSTSQVATNANIIAKLPRGGWLKNPFEDLKFKGKTDSQNPIKFIQRFEKIAECEGVNLAEQLYYFNKCM